MAAQNMNNSNKRRIRQLQISSQYEQTLSLYQKEYKARPQPGSALGVETPNAKIPRPPSPRWPQRMRRQVRLTALEINFNTPGPNLKWDASKERWLDDSTGIIWPYDSLGRFHDLLINAHLDKTITSVLIEGGVGIIRGRDGIYLGKVILSEQQLKDLVCLGETLALLDNNLTSMRTSFAARMLNMTSLADNE